MSDIFSSSSSSFLTYSASYSTGSASTSISASFKSSSAFELVKPSRRMAKNKFRSE